MQKLPGVAEKRLEQLYGVLSGVRRLLIVTHDNPDPDAIASAWALQRVARRLSPMRVDLAYGGIIGRSENRTLLEVLGVPLKPLASVQPERYQAIAMVDCQPGTGNNSLPEALRPGVVIDHHPLRRQTREAPFYDVREDYGATISIVSEYLFASESKVDRRLATAAFYAIKAETQNLGREAGRQDARAFLYYFPLVDNLALSRIEHPPISRDYFLMFDQAIKGTRLYGPVVVTRLGEVSNPDVAAEFADIMVRLEGIRWSLVLGRFSGDLILSVRTTAGRANAGRLIRRIVGVEGAGGGHGTMAGGKVKDGARDRERAEQMEALLVQRALQILKVDAPGLELFHPQWTPNDR